MKSKFSSMWRVGVALVMVLSLGLVMAVPAAATVSTPSVAVDPVNASEAAEYTITFTTNLDLALSAVDEVRIEFPSDTTITGWDATKVTINGDAVVDSTVVDLLVTLKVPVDVPAGVVIVVFADTAGIVNPSTAGDYTLDVSTSKEVTPVTSSSYTISLPAPTVDIVAPPKANQEETLDIVITGTNFSEDASVSFGSGITVDSFTVDSETQITATIIIAATATVGTRDVSVTTPTGTDTKVAGFTVQADGTELVDRYNSSGLYIANYTTITAAIAAAGGNDVLVAHAADYGENVVINKSITLESYMGPATTIIDASAETVERVAVQIMASTVTLGGDGVGFTIIAPDATTGLADRYGVEVYVDGTLSDVTIEGNTIKGSTNTGSDSPQVGIHLWGTATYSSLTIKDNTLTTTYTVDMTPMWTKTSAGIITAVNVQSLGGTFDGNSVTGFSIGMGLDNLNTATTIKNNTVTGCDFNGIWVSGAAAIDVYSNTISGCGGNGLAIGSVSDIDVYKNVIHGNGNGVKVYDGTDATLVTIQYNDIYSNTNTTLPEMPVGEEISYENCGVLNAGTGTLDAKYNFWGEIGGPNSATYAEDEVADWWAGTALGNGDIVAAVTGSTVLYDPWLTELQATVIADGIRSYGSDAIALAEGWNTLSVPCGLKGTADTFGDIQAMGDYLDDFVGGYWYDAAVPQWKGISSATTLEPGKGFYINMSDTSSFPVLYFDGMLHLPAYSMSAGWNLIGAMFGVDRDETTDAGDYGVAIVTDAQDGLKTVVAALDSIQASGSVVISPSLPGQDTAWATTVSDSTEKMLVGESYWVFMTADGTLAGFEVTPFYFTWTAP